MILDDFIYTLYDKLTDSGFIVYRNNDCIGDTINIYCNKRIICSIEFKHSDNFNYYLKHGWNDECINCHFDHFDIDNFIYTLVRHKQKHRLIYD